MKKLLAILILPLCVSIGMTMHLPAVAQGQSVRSESGWEKIIFSKPEDPKAAIKMYPISKGRIEESQTPDALRVRIAVTRSRTRNVGLLLLYIDDSGRHPYWCGSHGCRLVVYADEGNGYKEAADITAFPLVYLSTGGSQVSLLFCGSLQGGGKWELKNHVLVYVGSGTCPR